MDNKWYSLRDKPLSYADQSITESGSSDTNNSSIEKLKIPSEKTWKFVNFDLDGAVYFSDVMKRGQVKNISQSDLYFFIPLLRVLYASKNFKFDKEYTISIKGLSNLILCNTTQTSLKRIKKLIVALSRVTFEDMNHVLEYKKRDGLLPIIKFNKCIIFQKLKKKTDYVMISRKDMKTYGAKLIGRPKSFSLYLELFFIMSKKKLNPNFSSNYQTDSYQEITDKRIEHLFSIKAHHSLNEIKKEGIRYLNDVIGSDYLEVIQHSVTQNISPDNMMKYQKVTHDRKANFLTLSSTSNTFIIDQQPLQ